MKTMFLSFLFSLVLVFALHASTNAGNVVIPKSNKSVFSFGVMKLDSRDDRKATIISLKDQEDDEGDDEGDDSDDEEEE